MSRPTTTWGAGDHARACEEIDRVAARDARIVLASWTPGSVMPAMGQALGNYLPPPPASSGPPSRWGDPDAVRAMLRGGCLRTTATETKQLLLKFPDISAAAEFLIRTAGHVVSEQGRLVEGT